MTNDSFRCILTKCQAIALLQRLRRRPFFYIVLAAGSYFLHAINNLTFSILNSSNISIWPSKEPKVTYCPETMSSTKRIQTVGEAIRPHLVVGEGIDFLGGPATMDDTRVSLLPPLS